MFKKPYVAGIDGDAVVQKKIALQALLQDFGNNTGNIMFSESLYRNLDNAVRGTFNFTADDVEDCDVIVLAAANWMNPYSDFGDLAAKIEACGLPCVIVGIGAQSGVDKRLPNIHPGTMRLIEYAGATSGLISTRGGFSSHVLNHHGIKNCLATGCPSLLLNGAKAMVREAPASLTTADIMVHSTRHLWNQADAFQGKLYRWAMEDGCDILLQSELADMYYALGRTNNDEILSRAKVVLEAVYGQPIEAVAEYLKTHGKVPFAMPQWESFLKAKKFCIGTRLHGTVAALLAGTPAVLVTHDSRTVETAEAMSIPTVSASQIGEHFHPSAYVNQAAIAAYLSGYERYRRNFMTFFHVNGLQTSKYFDH
ncbi:polysaccharide pyruvyl transferase family protein [Shinella zoogloeoides]|uniref:polysaccharide pyruvyl transferase family protein n=1 Tax=Shinella zoogloeoides TaxID=352475 RepID=UPI00273FBBC7|nr:polysaccharide pyruvyl transferase family protein [Shinella zoogloeoides]WLR92958.1 polysaccharide pyruvyl transferase family protein [Shinella zoogloeoides]